MSCDLYQPINEHPLLTKLVASLPGTVHWPQTTAVESIGTQLRTIHVSFSNTAKLSYCSAYSNCYDGENIASEILCVRKWGRGGDAVSVQTAKQRMKVRSIKYMAGKCIEVVVSTVPQSSLCPVGQGTEFKWDRGCVYVHTCRGQFLTENLGKRLGVSLVIFFPGLTLNQHQSVRQKPA